jgi:hypothetical protein
VVDGFRCSLVTARERCVGWKTGTSGAARVGLAYHRCMYELFLPVANTVNMLSMVSILPPFLFKYTIRTRGSVVGIATGYGLDD